MNDTDTSDEAAFKFFRNWVGDHEFSHITMWQECRRRSETENERLRGLLTEWIQAGPNMPNGSLISLDKRTREALK